MINSINFIDGLDGLSTGISLIAALTLGLISLTTAVGPVGQPFIAVLCFILAGSLLGFLRWNFHPASIFVGTSGVMFVGYTLAVLSILGTAKVAVALLVLGVPIIDTFWIIVRRLANRTSPFTPDRGHVHHRLLDLGLGHTRRSLLIYGITAVLAVLLLPVGRRPAVRLPRCRGRVRHRPVPLDRSGHGAGGSRGRHVRAADCPAESGHRATVRAVAHRRAVTHRRASPGRVRHPTGRHLTVAFATGAGAMRHRSTTPLVLLITTRC